MINIVDVWLERSGEVDEVLIKFDILDGEERYIDKTLVFDLFFNEANDNWYHSLEFGKGVHRHIQLNTIEFVFNNREFFVKNKDLNVLLTKNQKHFDCGSFVSRYGV
jgi:hypothetical protein